MSGDAAGRPASTVLATAGASRAMLVTFIADPAHVIRPHARRARTVASGHVTTRAAAPSRHCPGARSIYATDGRPSVCLSVPHTHPFNGPLSATARVSR